MAIEADHKGQGDEEEDLEKGAITGRYSIPRQGRATLARGTLSQIRSKTNKSDIKLVNEVDDNSLRRITRPLSFIRDEFKNSQGAQIGAEGERPNHGDGHQGSFL